MKKYLFTLVALVATVAYNSVSAQDSSRIVCGSDIYYRQYAKEQPSILTHEKDLNLRAADFVQQATDTSVIIIPVVFHVMHTNGPENVNRKIILDQLATLNEIYQKQNKDTVNVHTEFKNLIGNSHIEFRLATKDPWGRCTDGVDRVFTAATENANDNIKALAWWDSRLYLNVWVCKSLEQNNPDGILAGYAQFPWELETRPATDGIVIGYQFIGKGKKTLIHEIGHWLGLYHTFQDGCVADPNLEGDHVDDTPPVLEANFGCPNGKNSCSLDSPDLPDMIENYMDYTDCTHMFTKDQSMRMRWFLKGAREKMITQENYDYVFASCETVIQEESKRELKALVYPNPSSGNITLMLENTAMSEVSIDVFEVTGKTLNNIHVALLSGQVSLSRSDLGIYTPGVYTLRVANGPEAGFVKLIISE